MSEGCEGAIAVLDAGKTNKKTVLFSEDLKLIPQESHKMGEVVIDRLLSDDVNDTYNWFLTQVRRASSKHMVKASSMSEATSVIARSRLLEASACTRRVDLDPSRPCQ